MKKIIGILGVAVIAATMFFNTNAVNSSATDTDLLSLVALNTANAESGCENGNASYYITYYDGSMGRIKGCLNGGSKCC